MAICSGPPYPRVQRGTIDIVPLEDSQPEVLATELLPLGEEAVPVGVDPEIVSVRSCAPDAGPHRAAANRIGFQIHQAQVLAAEILPLREEACLVCVDPQVVRIGAAPPDPGEAVSGLGLLDLVDGPHG